MKFTGGTTSVSHCDFKIMDSENKAPDGSEDFVSIILKILSDHIIIGVTSDTSELILGAWY